MLTLLDTISKRFHFETIGLTCLLAALFFTLPLSSSAKSICFVLAVVGIVATPSSRARIIPALLTPHAVAALLLFLLAVIALFWSPASVADKTFVIEKYSKLLYLPILIAGLRTERARDFAVKGFLGAMVLVSCVSIVMFWGIFFGVFSFLDVGPDYLFRNHIMMGLMMTFAAYLSMLFAFRSRGNVRWGYVILVCLFSYQVLCINGGRTGYVLYLLFALIFLVQVCSWRQMIGGVLLGGIVVFSSYMASPVMQSRVTGAVQQIKDYQNQAEKNTDIGLRLQYQAFAYQLFLRHPLFGNGTGSFTHYFKQERPVANWDLIPLEPHSFYWLVASEFGVIGLCVLFFFFASLWHACRQLKHTKAIAFALLICFMIGNLSDSLLFYSGSGYFFILFISLCLGEYSKRTKWKGECN